MAITASVLTSIGLAGAQTGLSTILGNNAGAKQKKAADKAAQKSQKYNKRVWRYNNDEANRVYDFKVEQQEIAKRNSDANLDFQDADLQQQWNYQMGIRKYVFDQETDAYNKSLATATQQKTYNENARNQARLDQSDLFKQQLAAINFSEQQLMLDFTSAQAGINLKKSQAQTLESLTQTQLTGQAGFETLRAQTQAASLKTRIGAESGLGIKQARSRNLLETQQTRIQALKAQGAALAAGQAGRSTRKVAQGIAAESGAMEAASTEQFMLAQQEILQKQAFDTMSVDEQLRLDTMGINQKLMYDQQNAVQQLLFTEQGLNIDLANISNQLVLDKAQISESRKNLNASNQAVLARIDLEKQQADLIADSKIMLKPEIAPPIPQPVALPRPEWGDIYKPEKPPEPIKSAGAVSFDPNAILAQNVASGISSIASNPSVAKAIGSLFKPNQTNFGVANYSSFANNLNTSSMFSPTGTLGSFPFSTKINLP